MLSFVIVLFFLDKTGATTTTDAEQWNKELMKFPLERNGVK